MFRALLQLFACLFPTHLVTRADLLIDENELFTHLSEENKPLPRSSLPSSCRLKSRPSEFQINFGWGAVAAVIAVFIFTAALADGDVLLAAVPLAVLNSKLDKSGLSNFYRTQIKAAILDPAKGTIRDDITEPVLDHFIAGIVQRAVAAGNFDPNKKDVGVWVASPDIRMGLDEKDKMQRGLEGLFLAGSIHPPTRGELKTLTGGIPPYRSFRQHYIDYTGDEQVTGRKDKSRHFVESLITTDWAEVVADAMNKALVRNYSMISLNYWRKLVQVKSLKNFKTQRRVRIGGYGNLPVVGQRAPYLPLASPTDEEATYVPAKRGGTEDITWEMVANDDKEAVQEIPNRLARLAAWTVHDFVMDMIIPSLNTESVGSPPNIYDGTALYTTAHGNKATAALDATAYKAARALLRKQAEKDSGKLLGLRAGYLIAPSDLEEMAYKLTMPAEGNANIVPKFEQTLGVEPIIVESWTDATDWVLAVKRDDLIGIEVGFLDGREDPQLIISEVANSGSWFTNDVRTVKVMHVYGGAILDARAFVGSIVVG